MTHARSPVLCAWPTWWVCLETVGPDPPVTQRGGPPSAVELAQRAAAGEFGPEVCAWLQRGFARQQTGASLDAALELDRASRIRARDQALLRAAQVLGPASSTWALAVRLAEAVRRFDVRVRPRLVPGDELPPLDDALRSAFACCVGVPATARQLYALLRPV